MIETWNFRTRVVRVRRFFADNNGRNVQGRSRDHDPSWDLGRAKGQMGWKRRTQPSLCGRWRPATSPEVHETTRRGTLADLKARSVKNGRSDQAFADVGAPATSPEVHETTRHGTLAGLKAKWDENGGRGQAFADVGATVIPSEVPSDDDSSRNLGRA